MVKTDVDVFKCRDMSFIGTKYKIILYFMFMSVSEKVKNAWWLTGIQMSQSESCHSCFNFVALDVNVICGSRQSYTDKCRSTTEREKTGCCLDILVHKAKGWSINLKFKKCITFCQTHHIPNVSLLKMGLNKIYLLNSDLVSLALLWVISENRSDGASEIFLRK